MKTSLVIATRGSQLALWQAEHVRSRLLELRPELSVELLKIKTRGDVILDVPLSKVGGKGLFIKEIEEALLDGRADLAVHSVKDVPMELPEGLILAAVPEREVCTDCLASETFAGLDALPAGARVGTCSLRRQAQLLHARPDLRILPLRGNVETRLRKLKEGEFDAVVLASAGMKRLGLSAALMAHLPEDRFVPAVGQGAIGIECRAADTELLSLLAQMEHRPTRVCVEAERGFLAGLDGGCQVPIAAHAVMLDENHFHLEGLVGEVDGSRLIRLQRDGAAEDARAVGLRMAEEILAQGADDILRRLYSPEQAD